MYMAVFADGIYYAPTNSQIWFYSFASKQTQRVMDLEKNPGSGFAISPDRRFLLLSPAEARHGDLYLIDNLN